MRLALNSQSAACFCLLNGVLGLKAYVTTFGVCERERGFTGMYSRDIQNSKRLAGISHHVNLTWCLYSHLHWIKTNFFSLHSHTTTINTEGFWTPQLWELRTSLVLQACQPFCSCRCPAELPLILLTSNFVYLEMASEWWAWGLNLQSYLSFQFACVL